MKRLLQSRLFTACVASTATALIVGSVAWAAQSPVDGNGVLHACYNSKTGDMGLDLAGRCPTKGRTTPISWNAQGIPGTPAASPSFGQVDGNTEALAPAHSADVLSSRFIGPAGSNRFLVT